MKKTLLSLFALAASALSLNAQVADFTATDTKGKTWNLYELFNQNKVVVIDMGFASCAACKWYHDGGFLETFDQTFGDNGEGTLQVMLANAYGQSFTGWSMNGVHFPVFESSNGSTVSQGFPPQAGYPAVYVLCPDKTVAENNGYYKLQSEATMRDYIENKCGVFNTNTDKVEKEVAKLSVFPNPASDEINITVTGMEEVKVQIIDITGKVVKDELVAGKMDISSLNAGLYMAKVEATGEVVRFVKK